MGESVSIRQLCARIDYGLSTSGTKDGPARFLRITDIQNSYVDWRTVPFCDASASEVQKYSLATGDVVVARTGASTGRSLWVTVDEPSVFASYLVRFRVGPRIASRYLGYVLNSEPWFRHVASHAYGKSAQPNMSAAAMAEFVILLPPLREQDAIAEVLGALDDKIAANERVNRCAGEVADAEFDRFRQVAKTIQRTFAEVAEVGGGGTPRTSVAEYWGESIPWATPTDVTGLAAPYLHQTSRSITDEGLAACSSSLYPIGSILMTSRATIGAFAIAQVPVAVNQGFIVVNAKDPELQWWIYHDMRSRVDEFLAHSNGATFLELPRGKFKQLPVQAPGLDAALRFSEVVGPLHGVATARLVENARLAATRDELLPLLMSGRLRVKDAEKVVAEVV